MHTVFEKRIIERSQERYVFQLYVAGLTPRSTLAIERIRTICDKYLQGRYELTIIDMYLHPEAARLAQIIVAPTLVREIPSPMRFLLGDLKDEKKVLLSLNITH